MTAALIDAVIIYLVYVSLHRRRSDELETCSRETEATHTQKSQDNASTTRSHLSARKGETQAGIWTGNCVNMSYVVVSFEFFYNKLTARPAVRRRGRGVMCVS